MDRLLLRHRMLALAAALLLAPGAATAPAATDDEVVRVPSDSPAGREYSVPLDDARRTGEPEDDGTGEQAPAAPFGEGIGTATTPGDGAPGTSTVREPAGSGSPAPGAGGGAGTGAGGSGGAGVGGSATVDPARAAAGGGLSLPLLGALLIGGFAIVTGGATVLLRRRSA